jgi:hypothetical protein
MEDAQWLARVLEACSRALASQDQGIEANAGLVTDLEELEASLRRQQAERSLQ